MSRIAENKQIVESINESIDEPIKRIERGILISDDNIRNVNLGPIAVILADISKSLAVIADVLNKEE